MNQILVMGLISLTSLSLWAEAPAAKVAQGGLPESTNSKVHNEDLGAVKQARVFFIEPKNGATVPSKFKVKMGLEGLKIRPAGEAPDEVTSGHHHLLVDAPAAPAKQPVPADATHIHFGKGQTETELTLAPGDHTLTLQFADGAHRSFGEQMSSTIKIHVK